MTNTRNEIEILKKNKKNNSHNRTSRRTRRRPFESLFATAFARRLQIGHLKVIFSVAIIMIIFCTTIFIFTIANVVGVVSSPVPTFFYSNFFFEKARAPVNPATINCRNCLRVIIMRFYDGVIERLYKRRNYDVNVG